MKSLLGEEVYTRLFSGGRTFEKKNLSSNTHNQRMNQILADNIQLGKDKVRNTKLVSVLKQKMFKGYMKIKAINDYRRRPKSRPISSISVNGKKFRIKKKKKKDADMENFMDRNKSEMNNYLQIEKCINQEPQSERKSDKLYQTTLYKSLFVTERQNKKSREKGETEDDKERMLLNQIYDKNFQEIDQYNRVTFLALNVKKPQSRTHYGTNKAKIEREILKEIEAINKIASGTGFNTANNSQLNIQQNNNQVDQMGKTSKSEFLYKISRIDKDRMKDKSLTYMNFRKNPGLVKGYSKIGSSRPSGKAFIDTPDQNIIQDKLSFGINTLKKEKSLPPSGNVSMYQSNSQSNMLTTPFPYVLDQSEKSKYGKTLYNSKAKMTRILQENDTHLARMENFAVNYDHLHKKSTPRSMNILSADGVNLSKPMKLVKNIKDQFDLAHNLFQELASIPDILTERKEENNETDPNFLNSNTNDSFFSNKISKTKNYNYDQQKKPPKSSKENYSLPSYENKNFRNVRNNIIAEKKNKFNRLKEMVFDGKYEANFGGGSHRQDSDNKLRFNTFYNTKMYEKEKLNPRDQQTKQSRSRDYKISKHLYRIYDKEEVDTVIYGREKVSGKNILK